jgi:hypothetical protein
LVQAREYQALGYEVADWISNAKAALVTDSAKRIAENALGQNKNEWQRLKA